MSQKPFIYTLSTCGHCKRTKQFLKDQNIDFDFIDVDLCQGDERTRTVDEVKKYNPRCTFPTILVGDRVIVGYKEDEIKQALGMS